MPGPTASSISTARVRCGCESPSLERWWVTLTISTTSSERRGGGTGWRTINLFGRWSATGGEGGTGQEGCPTAPRGGALGVPGFRPHLGEVGRCLADVALHAGAVEVEFRAATQGRKGARCIAEGVVQLL